MNNLKEINDSHKKALKITKEKIDVIDNNEQLSNSNEKRRALVETMPLINLVFKVIRDNFPNTVKDLSIKHPSISRPVFEQLENILNRADLCLFVTSKTTFTVTAVNNTI